MAMRGGNYKEADATLNNLLLLQLQEYGNGPNPNIAFTHSALGQLALAKGDLPAAEKEYELSAKMYIALYGQSDLKTAQSMANLAAVLVKEHQYQRAEQQARPAVQAFTARPLPGNPNVGVAELTLGEALLGQKRYKEAIEPLSAAHEIFKTAPSAFAKKMEDDRRDLVQAYTAINVPEKAAQYQSVSSPLH
jgi:tetratricopeptide (TPR) repeat protein